jgi:hypothetical protein
MPLPDSGPISGSQIWAEVTNGTGANTNLSISGMFASSSLSTTNPDAYSEFWGYQQRISMKRYSSTIAKPSFGCNSFYTYTLSVWYLSTTDPIASYPGVGTICYTTETGSTVLANGNYAISLTASSSKPYSVITIANGTGYVSTVLIC